tara:strand:- start:2610 stop:3224 length:615 start_codon:yes stop_codon:yes gene_type:complete
MTTPAKTKNIHEAFVAAQKLIGGARKTATNPHFKSKYANLEEVLKACSDILNDHDIHITQPTMQEDGKFFVRTILTHISGETMQDYGVPIIGWEDAKNSAQVFIAGQTYARRGGLSSLVGIAPADDDGESLTQAAPSSVVTRRSFPKSDKISAQQAVQLNDLAAEVGADKGKFCAYLGVKTFEDINASQFTVAINALEKKKETE